LCYKEEVAFCNVWKKYPGTADSNFRLLQGFRGLFKLETFKFHEASNSHKNAVTWTWPEITRKTHL
jgi:hypothetical protein